MLRLLNIEIHKLKYNSSSRNLIIIYFVLLLSIALVAAVKLNFGFIEFNLADQGIFDFPYIWHFNTYIAAILKFFLLLVIVSMMSNEYSYKTIKQNLIDGLSKKEFILSKFYTVLLFSAISTLFVFIISLTLGLIYSSYNEFSIIIKDLDFILAFFIKLTAFFSFGLFLGILIKRSAFAVAAMIVWRIIESILGSIIIPNTPLPNHLKNGLPLTAMENLIKQPFTRTHAAKSVGQQINLDLALDYSVHISDMLIVIIWTGIFIYLSYYLLKSRDL